MKVFLESDNSAIASIVAICCERAGSDLVEDLDVGCDLYIKDCDQIEDIVKDEKTLLLLPKSLKDEADKNSIIKPFLPTELINFLQNYKKESLKHNAKQAEISAISEIVKEIDDLDEELFESDLELGKDDLRDFNIENLDNEKPQDTQTQNGETLPKIASLEESDNISLEDLALELENLADSICLDDLDLKSFIDTDDSYLDSAFDNEKLETQNSHDDEISLDELAVNIDEIDNEISLEDLVLKLTKDDEEQKDPFYVQNDSSIENDISLEDLALEINNIDYEELTKNLEEKKDDFNEELISLDDFLKETFDDINLEDEKLEEHEEKLENENLEKGFDGVQSSEHKDAENLNFVIEEVSPIQPVQLDDEKEISNFFSYVEDEELEIFNIKSLEENEESNLRYSMDSQYHL